MADLTPITREEKIIAGEDIKPVTRRERFLKKFGGGNSSGDGADWNASEGEAGYVKNRTHYEETAVVNEPLNITWDGDTEGLTVVDYVDEDGEYFFGYYKVSDAVLTDEQLMTSKYTFIESDEIREEKIADLWDELVSVGNVTAEYTNAYGVLVVKVPCEKYPECGIYFSKDWYDDGSYNYTESFATTESLEHTKTIVHKIKKKFLPDEAIARSTFIVEIYYDENGYLTSSKTTQEIEDAYRKGQVVMADNNSTLLTLCSTPQSSSAEFSGVFAGDFGVYANWVRIDNGEITLGEHFIYQASGQA